MWPQLLDNTHIGSAVKKVSLQSLDADEDTESLNDVLLKPCPELPISFM